MKCDDCGDDCNHSIYITKEHKKICSGCYDKIREEREKNKFVRREEVYSEPIDKIY